MNYNDNIMIPHNAFESTVTHWDTSLHKGEPSQRRCEKDYVQSTPISPIKLSSFAMNQVTPQFENENAYMDNDNFVIEHLIDLLQSVSDIVKFEAVSSMLQLITNQTAKKVVELDGIFCLAKALESAEEVVRDECARCLGKLACISPSIRDSVITDEGLVSLLKPPSCNDRLFKLNTTMSDNSRRVIIEAITECFNDETKPSSKACEILISQFIDLLQNECNEFVINEICKGIIYICPGNIVCIKAFIDNGIKARLTHLLTHQNEMVVTAALRAIRCLVLPKVYPGSNENQTTHVDHFVNSRHVDSEGERRQARPRTDSRDRNNIIVEKSLPSGVMQCVKYDNCSPLHHKATLKAYNNVRGNQSVGTQSTSARSQESSEVFILSPLTSTSMQKQTYAGLNELDLITCQNVEMFKATEEDTNDREAEAGSAIVGQVGLRCIHCGQSPFAKAQFSVVYPGSISLLPASLRHMAQKHFQRCEQTPLEISNRMKDLSLCIGSSSNGSALKKFCADLCMSVGVVSRHPQRSGLVVENSMKLTSFSEKQIPTPKRQIVPVSLFHPLQGGVIDPHDPSNHGKPQLQFTPTRQKPNKLQLSATSPQMDQNKISEPNGFQDHHDHHLQAIRVYGGVPSASGFIANSSSAPYQGIQKSTSTSCIPIDRVRNLKNDKSVIYQRSPQVTTAFKYQFIHDEGLVTRTTYQVASPSKIMHQGSAPSHSASTINHQSFQQPSSQQGDSMNALSKEFHPQSLNCISKKGNEPLENDSVVLSNPPNLNTVEKSSDSDFSLQSTLNYGAESCNTDILRPGDENLLTDYTFFAMCQFKSCVYSKTVDGKRRSDTSKPKSRFEENFPGLQCIHCVNGKNPRKFFFSKADRLSNSVHEMTTHLGKCKHCPSDIKAKLNDLKTCRQVQQYKLPRGSHRQFFKKVWERLHGKQNLSEDPLPCCIAKPEDKQWFDESECLVRKGIQVFCATKFDASFWKASIRKLDVKVGQVGLRCLYCAREEMDTVDLDATIFPSKIENIRDDIKLLHQKHHKKCNCAPQHIKSMLKTTKKSTPTSSVESDKKSSEWAKTLGLFNDEDGVVLYKQNAKHQSKQQKVLPPRLEPADAQGSISQSTFFDEILSHPPLEILDVNENTTMITTNTETSILPSNNDEIHKVPHNSSTISVTSCIPGTKRSHENVTQDETVVQEDRKKRCCAV